MLLRSGCYSLPAPLRLAMSTVWQSDHLQQSSASTISLSLARHRHCLVEVCDGRAERSPTYQASRSTSCESLSEGRLPLQTPAGWLVGVRFVEILRVRTLHSYVRNKGPLLFKPSSSAPQPPAAPRLPAPPPATSQAWKHARNAH